MKLSKNILYFTFGSGARKQLGERIDERRSSNSDYAVVFVDHYFNDHDYIHDLGLKKQDKVIFVDTTDEPKTTGIDEFRDLLKSESLENPCAVVGVGGGATLDTCKAVSNLLTNPGKAADYQGWDLVKNPAIYKIGVPTLSGTGAEASRTCVMTNMDNGLKLGMNSDHTIYDELIMDPDFSVTVPDDQYFYTGMDSYIHCVESLAGSYRHPVGDAYSAQSLDLVRKIYLSENMKSEENRADLMIASYFGGIAIGNSFVGVVHPFSAGLSVALGYHHCIGNCIALQGLFEFYPEAAAEMEEMRKKAGVKIPKGVCQGLSDAKHEELYNSTVMHEKPLINALGENFKEILTRDKVRELFEGM